MSNFKQNLKAQVSEKEIFGRKMKDEEVDKLVDKIAENPQVLKDFPTEKLIKLKDYYEKRLGRK